MRIVRPADDYSCQFLVDVDIREKIDLSYSEIGLDVGMNHFYTDNKGNQLAGGQPRYTKLCISFIALRPLR
ncbi:MAG: hypothetical protein QNJ70_28690 [Xenococcaceae cyanobacterium MO_207.B15]|nr:hypothetical protein [Xenococcaceae cyanobacterium MO_207.B15]